LFSLDFITLVEFFCKGRSFIKGGRATTDQKVARENKNYLRSGEGGGFF